MRAIVTAPMASVAVKHFRYRMTAIVGSLMSVCGFIIGAFTTNIATLYFSISILAGMFYRD